MRPESRVGSRPMHLHDFLAEDAVQLSLAGRQRDDILPELVALLHVGDDPAATLLKALHRRESLGSTGVGRGIAIPHCRSPVVDQLRLAYGRQCEGVDYQAIDGKPVHHFFLIVAPPVEASNLYLPVLGRIAQFAKELDVPERLLALGSPAEFFSLLEEKGV
jgi:PTS system nitrogen regulatory IIA component